MEKLTDAVLYLTTLTCLSLASATVGQWRRHPHAVIHPGAILLDLHLPDMA